MSMPTAVIDTKYLVDEMSGIWKSATGFDSFRIYFPDFQIHYVKGWRWSSTLSKPEVPNAVRNSEKCYSFIYSSSSARFLIVTWFGPINEKMLAIDDLSATTIWVMYNNYTN